MDDDREPGAPGGPPPPPGASPVPAPPPPPPGSPTVGGAQPGWGPADAAPSGWDQAGVGPQGWGAASPDAQVSWDRPQSGSNGCLKGCLIVGGILVVLAIIGIVGLVIAGGRLAQQIQENPDAVFGGECAYVTPAQVSDALGEEAQVFRLDGLADGTVGAILDKRLLRDAPDCYILGRDGTTGRIAVLDGGGPAAFAAAAAESQRIRGSDAELGDEAFCTTLDTTGFGGVLVRFGDRVAYVSVLDQALDEESACAVATSIAATLAP